MKKINDFLKSLKPKKFKQINKTELLTKIGEKWMTYNNKTIFFYCQKCRKEEILTIPIHKVHPKIPMLCCNCNWEYEKLLEELSGINEDDISYEHGVCRCRYNTTCKYYIPVKYECKLKFCIYYHFGYNKLPDNSRCPVCDSVLKIEPDGAIYKCRNCDIIFEKPYYNSNTKIFNQIQITKFIKGVKEPIS